MTTTPPANPADTLRDVLQAMADREAAAAQDMKDGKLKIIQDGKDVTDERMIETLTGLRRIKSVLGANS